MPPPRSRHPLSRVSPSVVLASVTMMSGCAEQLPLEVALDYVYRHPEYVIADPEADEIVSVAPNEDDARLDRHLAGDWVARQLSSYAEADMADTVSWAQRSIEITRATMFSQRHPGLDLASNDCVCDAGFDDGTFARLVRGFSNCDGVNGLLAMLLLADTPDVEMHHVDGEDSGHTLTVINVGRTLIFADAWADFGLMSLDGSDAPPGVQAYEALGPDDPGSGVYTRDQYARSSADPNVDLFFGLREAAGPDLDIPADLPPIRDARDAYLRARVFDIYGLGEAALPYYLEAIERGCDDPRGTICRLATEFTPPTALIGIRRPPAVQAATTATAR